MKRSLIIFHFCTFLLFISGTCVSQTPIVDSLKKISLRVSKDSASVLYAKIANIFTGVNSDSVRKYAAQASAMASEKSKVRGDAMIQFGNSYHMENKIDSALIYYKKALVFFSSIGHEKGIGKVYQSFSVVKNSTGDLLGAIEDSKKAAEIYEKIGWPLGMTNVYNNISISYNRLGNVQEMIRYSRLAFSSAKLLNDSLKYFSMMSSYGGNLCKWDRTDSAIYYIHASTPFLERNGMYNLLIPAYANLATALDKKGPSAQRSVKEALLKASQYSLLAGSLDNLRYIYRDLALIYLAEKKNDSVKHYFLKTLGIIDTLAFQEGIRLTSEIETKYETEKKELQIKNQALELDAKQKENDAKNRLLLWGAVGILVVAIFAIVAFVNYIRARRAKRIIEEQKKEVELKNEEITHQKELVDIKQKEIIDSINYAQRIQQAVLTGESVWNKVSKDHFILFKPKDIVSGDFYWAYNLPNGRSVFALADCTGHGVPGGFMSMLGNSFLNEIVVENKIFKADEILNKLRSKVIAALGQKGETEQKDGMDISLCVWNKLDNTLEFAGANNPLWLLREGQIIEYKADKMPIGTYLENEQPFSAELINLQKGDIIYLSTDGYADQFGGSTGKKMKYKPFLNLLISNSEKEMAKQHLALVAAFDGWKAGYDQVDDVSVIGLRV